MVRTEGLYSPELSGQVRPGITPCSLLSVSRLKGLHRVSTQLEKSTPSRMIDPASGSRAGFCSSSASRSTGSPAAAGSVRFISCREASCIQGTAAPTAEERARVPHHLVGTLRLEDYYSAARYEEEALALIRRLHAEGKRALLCGGSMMYIDAVCRGIDDLPTIPPGIRAHYAALLQEEHAAETLCRELLLRDPEYYAQVDRRNLRRVAHALEIIEAAGQTYTSLRRRSYKPRPFRTLKIGLDRPRPELFARIGARTEQMLHDGLLDEVRRVYPLRHLNSLNTVGYKELFRVVSGEWALPFALERMKKNTRVYAKKQLTWFRRDPSIHWFHPAEEDRIVSLLHSEGLL